MRQKQLLPVGVALLACSFVVWRWRNHGTTPPQKMSVASGPTPKASPSPIVTKSSGFSILTYHRIADHPAAYTVTPPAQFARQMAYLKRHHFQVVPLSLVVDRLHSHQELPRHAVALTFDDGFKSCYTEVFPVLRRYQFPATLFVYTDYIGGGRAALTWAELREMASSGLIDVQSHTLTHPDLTRRKTGESATAYNMRLKDELARSKAEIESHLGSTVTQLAYPYGSYDNGVVAAAGQAGYTTAYTVNEAPLGGTPAPGVTALTLPRQIINREDTMADFIAKVNSSLLPLDNPSPAPGTAVTPKPAEIAVTLPANIQPDSITMLLGRKKVVTTFDNNTCRLSYAPPEPMRVGSWPINLLARDREGRPFQGAWLFNVVKGK